jgi:hypothetical protein
MTYEKILLTSMFFGLMLGGCSSEESKLESEIINKDAFLAVKNDCEFKEAMHKSMEKSMEKMTGKATEETMAGQVAAVAARGNLKNCVETFFYNRTKEVCAKNGLDLLGATCPNVDKRVKARVADYLAEDRPK